MQAQLFQLVWLVPLGLLVGTLGTLIGAGGGFILVPVLLLLYPQVPPETITSISLAVVFLNALSGSIAYSRMKRIDYKSGLLFSAAAIPGALIGAWTTHLLSRGAFNAVFGTILILVAVFLAWRTRKPAQDGRASAPQPGKSKLTLVFRTIVDWEEITHVFSYNPVLGVSVSVFVGFLSSLLGIGGGIFHVPLLATTLNFPIHIATATSHFVLAIMSFAGTLVHIVAGEFTRTVVVVAGLGVGVVLGAQLGARFSNRVNGTWIIRALAGALILVGARLLISF